MKLTLTVTMGNDAMQTRKQAAGAILSALYRNTARLDDPFRDGDDGVIMDENGNTVGGWQADEEGEPAADINGEPGKHSQADLDRMIEALEETGRYDVTGRRW